MNKLIHIITIVARLVIWVGFSVIRDGIPFFSRDSIYGVPAKISEVLLIWLLSTDKESASPVKMRA